MQALRKDDKGKDFLFLGYPMHLTPTELRIVQCLIEHENATCDIASFDAGSAATVSVHVCAINKKAQSIGGRRLIKTVRGRGYRFCDDI